MPWYVYVFIVFLVVGAFDYMIIRGSDIRRR